jgi:ADP-dependent NAD(P)H-hydrate dehydratase / NAD(P)H-hydrate epimerase
MRTAHEVAAVRAAEQELMATLPPGTLMQRAAAGLAAVCAGVLGRVYGTSVVVLAGSGDNGGDALYAGARLARRGARVTAVAAASRVHEQGAAALRAAGGRVTGPGDPDLAGLVGGAGLVLDGLLGVGGRGGLTGPYATLAALAATGPVVVAVDLPSGIDADTGAVDGPAVRADVTVTFGTWKPGLLIDPGAAQPPAESDKYRRGVLGIVAGSDRFTGAATLAVGGALRGGAGMVRLITSATAAAVARQHWPEALVTVAGDGAQAGRDGQGVAGAGQNGQDAAAGGQDGQDAAGAGRDAAGVGRDAAGAGRVQAWVAGPGMGTQEAARDRLAAVLATGLPVLVDADGLTLIGQEPRLLDRAAPTLLTPHAGELARLLGIDPMQVAPARLMHARAAASRFGVTVLLKGSTTVVAPAGGGTALVNSTGTSWLATAGTGDVLSGLAGALLAHGLPVPQAAAAAAYLHGLAGRLAAAGLTGPGPAGPGLTGPDAAAESPIAAGDVIRALPAAIRRVRATLVQ